MFCRVKSRLSKLEKESARLFGSHGELQRDLCELCELVLDIACNIARRQDPAQRHIVDRDNVVQESETSQRRATRRLVARFNYDPFKMSPNADPESELSLRAGECVTVIGNVDSVSHSMSSELKNYHYIVVALT